MRVSISKFSGFCPGVKAAEKRLLEQKEQHPQKPLVILGELIHNKNYIEYLRKQGINTALTAEDIPNDKKAVIRTHGLNNDIESHLAKHHEILDLTCPKVKSLQKTIADYGTDHFIVLSGKRNHPEILGLISYARHYCVLANDDDIENFVHNRDAEQRPLREEGYRKILVASQTTAPYSLYRKVLDRVSEAFSDKYAVTSLNSICSITSRRENKALELQQQVDVSFVIGDEKSSNANKLYAKLKEADERTYFIEDLKDLRAREISLSGYGHAMVVSSSSTPDFVEKEVVEYLEGV